MAKLTGAKKKAFLERMAKGRRKATRGGKNPRKKGSAKTKRKSGSAPKKPAPKKKAAKKSARAKNGKLTGKAKAAFLKRMAKGRHAATRNGTRPKKKLTGKKRGRRNSDMGPADKMFETFHQKRPGHTIEWSQAFHYPSEFAELGRLMELRFHLDSANPHFPLTSFGPCQVVCTPDGRNIYFIGGDQRVNLDALDIESDKDLVELGACTHIAYFTTKGFHDFAPTKYYHDFGEVDGILPRLAYDQLNDTMFLLSGNYTVRRAGIEN